MTNKDLKVCRICKDPKPINEFNKNKCKKDGLQSQCIGCGKERSAAYYVANKEHHKKVVAKHKKVQVAINQQYVYDYSKEHGCVDCQEKDPCCLDFDHVSGTKTEIISVMVNSGCSLPLILEEIAKCEIRCANCHRRKTAKDFSWYKNIDTGSVVQR